MIYGYMGFIVASLTVYTPNSLEIILYQLYVRGYLTLSCSPTGVYEKLL